MKTLILSVIAIVSAASFAQEKNVNIEKSKIEWKGYKVIGSHHEGKIQLKEGKFILNNNKLTGGHFVVDMNSISVDDLQGNFAQKLVNHLKDDDFFSSEKFPTSSLKFTEVTQLNPNSYKVKADLTIKGKTLPVDFVLSLNNNKAKAHLKIDRTQYDIKYGSNSFFDNLGDKAISNEFDINVDFELL